MRKWLAFVEDNYVASNPYHSSVHAADVTQAVHWMLKVGGGSEFLSKFECLSLLLSAMAHDMGHDGFNNAFHKATVSQRAIEHNDQSIQENYHVSFLFGAMAKDPSINIFKRFDPHKFLEMRYGHPKDFPTICTQSMSLPSIHLRIFDTQLKVTVHCRSCQCHL